MRHSLKHKQAHYKDNNKILLNIDNNHKLCVKVEISGGYLIEDEEVFLYMHDGPIIRKIYTMEKILEYCKEALYENIYLRVEKFFMERNT